MNKTRNHKYINNNTHKTLKKMNRENERKKTRPRKVSNNKMNEYINE